MLVGDSCGLRMYIAIPSGLSCKDPVLSCMDFVDNQGSEGMPCTGNVVMYTGS